MKCRRCKVNEDARTRLGGDCHRCVAAGVGVLYPVIRAFGRVVGW